LIQLNTSYIHKIEPKLEVEHKDTVQDKEENKVNEKDKEIIESKDEHENKENEKDGKKKRTLDMREEKLVKKIGPKTEHINKLN